MSEPKPSRLPQIAIGSALLAVVVSIVAAIVVLLRDDAPAPLAAKSPSMIDQRVTVADVAQLRDKLEVVVDAGMPRGVRVTDATLATTLGLHDGDVITALMGRKLTHESDVRDVMTRARSLRVTTLYAEIERAGAAALLRWQLDTDLSDLPRSTGSTSSTGSLGSLGTPPYLPPSTSGTLKNPFDDVDALLDSIEQVDDTHTRVPKKTFEELLASPSAYMRSARVVPSIKNGDPNGYKLYAIRPRSLAARLGLQNGDTIHSINGHDLVEVDDVVSLLNDAKNKTSLFRLELTRRGKPVQLEIEITK